MLGKQVKNCLFFSVKSSFDDEDVSTIEACYEKSLQSANEFIKKLFFSNATQCQRKYVHEC